MSRLLSVVLVLICGTLLLAPQLSPYEESEQHRLAPLQPPTHIHFVHENGHIAFPFVVQDNHGVPLQLKITGQHWFTVSAPANLFLLGSDEFGRDLFSRFLYGGRRALLVGAAASCIAMLIGFLAGSAAGLYGGWVDALLMRAVELFLSLPWMYLLLAIRALLPLNVSEPGVAGMVIGVAVLAGWPRPARLIRGICLSVKQRPYVAVARSLGANPFYIAQRHIFPEIRGVLLVQLTVLLPRFMLVDVALSFLGLAGDSDRHASWGALLASLKHFSVMESHSGYLWVTVCITFVLILLQFDADTRTHKRM